MPKVVLSPIGNPENSSFVTELNGALDTLADEFEEVVYRDGSFNLTGNLDMGNRRILNLPFPASPTEPIRLGDVTNFQGTPGIDGEDAPSPVWTHNVSTGAPGTNVLLDITGTYPTQTFNWTIPRGSPGASGALGDGVYGDISVTGTGSVLTVVAGAITLAKMANLASAGVVGATAPGAPSVLSFATVKTNLALVKADVGLSNVDNTSDANKPVSTATQTALNLKQNLVPNIQTPATNAASIVPTFSNDQVNLTGHTVAIDFDNPTGTAQDGWGIVLRVKDNGVAKAITYDTQYRAFGASLPTTTIAGKTMYIGMVYNAADTKWDVVSVVKEV